MFFLCTTTSFNIEELVGRRALPDQEATEPLIDKPLIVIGQSDDCTSYLVLTEAEHEKLIKHNSVPDGYTFIFRQSWGLHIDEDKIHRVIDTLRAESYPPISDYLDAKVKGDTQQEADYIAKCKAVKEKYPKFSF